MAINEVIAFGATALVVSLGVDTLSGGEWALLVVEGPNENRNGLFDCMCLKCCSGWLLFAICSSHVLFIHSLHVIFID